MQVYFANMYGVRDLEKYLPLKIAVLVAYPQLKNKEVEVPSYCHDLFVDSGAFGKNSEKIDVDSYSEFLAENEMHISVYANLDVLGNAKASFENQKKMEAHGLKPMPVFHYGTPFDYLQYYISHEYPYIGLGGMVSASAQQQKNWLDYVWGMFLTDNGGHPLVKVHGFGIQNEKLLQRYPWHSADASSVHMQARYGGIYTPWGWIKINPNVNAKEVSYQTYRPREFDKVKEYTRYFLPEDYSFDDAARQDSVGIALRCTISIRYILKRANESRCNCFEKLSETRRFNI